MEWESEAESSVGRSQAHQRDDDTHMEWESIAESSEGRSQARQPAQTHNVGGTPPQGFGVDMEVWVRVPSQSQDVDMEVVCSSREQVCDPQAP